MARFDGKGIVAVACSVVFCTGAACVELLASVPAPQVIPKCESPQQVSPAQMLCSAADSGYHSLAPSVAWNGKDFGALWVEYQGASGKYRPFFRAVYADGTPKTAAIPVQNDPLTDPEAIPQYTPPRLLWTGQGYAAVWAVYETNYLIYFALLWPDGTLRSGPTQVSSVGLTATNGLVPTLAFSGDTYLVAWQDDRYNATRGYDILATFLDTSGTITGGGTRHDIPLTPDSEHQFAPSAAWAPSWGAFVMGYQDTNSGYAFIRVRYMDKTGTFLSSSLASTPGAYDSVMPSVAVGASGVGVSWHDTRHGNYEIYFSTGYYTYEVRVSSTAAESANPTLAWTGGEYGLFWEEGDYPVNIWQARFSGDGVLQAPPIQITNTMETRSPAAAFGKRGFLVAGTQTYANAAFPVGCGAPVPPPCPENALAYAITGTTATIAWLPVQDLNFDIAYYEIYRNDALRDVTDETYYADSGLVPNGTYNYSIRAVNATQLASTSCGSGASVYVKANASLLLMVSKATPDAVLDWTDDGTMTNYNIFRGTSPQVMTLIGNTVARTAEDPNVLLDNNLYFYTVDDPVQ